MRRWLVVTALAGVVLMLTATTASGSSRTAAETARLLGSGEGRSYVDDEDSIFYYRQQGSESDCGGNPSCDIVSGAFFVSKDSPDDFDAVVVMAGSTDGNMSNSQEGGMGFLISTEKYSSGWEFGMWTSYRAYPLNTIVREPILVWDGDSWESTGFQGFWFRGERGWVASVPWKLLGVKTVRAAVRAADASGQVDLFPANNGTPWIPIAALVAGAPGQPLNVRATPGAGQVSVSWDAPTSSGSSPVTSYRVTASPGGEYCETSTTSCVVTGLAGGTSYSFGVTATNAQGTGPSSDAASATPSAGALAAPRNVKATYVAKGAKGTATVTWTRPAGATSMQVRWALNGGSFTAWKTVAANKVSVPGLVKGKATAFEVRGVDAAGPGASTAIRLALK